ncbi:hypothetical protein, partial [Methylacidiphilum caldifontis]
KVLRRLQSIRLVQLSTKGKPVTWLLSRIPTELRRIASKTRPTTAVCSSAQVGYVGRIKMLSRSAAITYILEFRKSS